MFDKDGFDKLKDELNDHIKELANDAVKSIEKAFSKLPQKMQEALDTEGVDGLLHSTGKLTDKLKQAEAVIAQIEKNKAKFNKDVVPEWLDALKKKSDEFKKQNKITRAMIANYASSTNPFYQAIAAQLTQQMADDKKVHNRELRAGRKTANAAIVGANTAFDSQKADALEARKEILYRNRLTALKDILITAGFFIAAQIGKVGQSLLKAGLDGRQVVENIPQVFKGEWDALKEGVAVSPKQFADAQGAVGNTLGRFDGDTKTYAIEAAKLANLYGLSASSAGHLVGQLTRMNGYSKEAAQHITDYALALAHGNKLAANSVLVDMAENSEALARYAGTYADEFERASIAAHKIGVPLKEIDALSGRMVDDFGGALQSMAQLQTAIPGVDLNRFLVASQFNPGKAPEELRRAFAGKLGPGGFQSLPRSIQDMITKATGLSSEYMNNLLNPKGLSTKLEKADTQTAKDRNWETSIAVFAKDISDNLGKILGTIVGWKFLFGGGGGGSLLKGLGIGAGIKSVVGGVAGAGKGLFGLAIGGGSKSIPIIGGALAFGKHLYHGDNLHRSFDAGLGATGGGLIGRAVGGGLGGLLGSVVPVIGTAAGALAGQWLGGAVGTWLGEKGGEAYYDYHHKGETAIDATNQPVPNPDVNTQSATDSPEKGAEESLAMIAKANTDQVKLLSQVLKAIQEGKVINLDGKALVKGLTAAHSRG